MYRHLGGEQVKDASRCLELVGEMKFGGGPGVLPLAIIKEGREKAP